MNLPIALPKPDRLDLMSVLAAAACLVWLALLGLSPSAAPTGTGAPAVAPPTDLEEIDLRGFLGHYPPTRDDDPRLAEFLARHPRNALAHYHLGLSARGEGRLADAAGSFARALSIRRDLADRANPLESYALLDRFAEEGLGVFLRERALRPGDPAVERAVNDLYYIRRGLAGGCD
jgi:hypothetical protein